MPYTLRDEYSILAEKLAERNVDLGQVKARLKAQAIETPSWAYANSGTRFGTFRQPGAAVTIEEKLADAAQVHRFTGVAPSVAVHVLWDFPEGIGGVNEYAKSLGMRIGAINPNVFQDQCYKLGSLGNPDPVVRQRALDHMLDSVEIGRGLGSNYLSLWFADGTNFPGQGDFRQRKAWFQEGLKAVYDAMPETMTMLIEYKLFEPHAYYMDLADWGNALVFAQHCGERAKVLVDLGHHAHGTNIPYIVAFLVDESRFGGFHFNDRKSADDDLTTGSIDPYQLFLIYSEIVAAENSGYGDIAFMVDQSHTLKPKIEEMIQTVCQIQSAYAKALIADRPRLAEAQADGRILDAELTLRQAFDTDVEPLLKVLHEEMGLDPNPLQAYRASGYQAKIEAERGARKDRGGLGQ